MRLATGTGALIAMMALLGGMPGISHAQNGGWAAPKGEQDFLQNRYPELKGLTNSAEDQKNARDLCSKYRGGNQAISMAVVRCNVAAQVYMSEGQKEADAQRQQELSLVQASEQTRRSQQGGEASASLVGTQEAVSIPSASKPAQAAVDSFSDDDIVDYVAKTLAVYATHQGDASICAANPEVQQCAGRLQTWNEQHFPDENVSEVIAVRHHADGDVPIKRKRTIRCPLKFSGVPEAFREWGGVLAGDESKWDAGISGVRSKVSTNGCSAEEVAYFDKITSAALESAKIVVTKLKGQTAARSEALIICKASVPYERFDNAKYILQMQKVLTADKESLEEYQRVQPTTVQDANKLQAAIGNANATTDYAKKMLAQKLPKYQSLGGNIDDHAQISKDASSNPCASLGDNWEQDYLNF